MACRRRTRVRILPTATAGIFQSPQSGARLPTYSHEDNPLTLTLDSALKKGSKMSPGRQHEPNKMAALQTSACAITTGGRASGSAGTAHSRHGPISKKKSNKKILKRRSITERPASPQSRPSPTQMPPLSLVNQAGAADANLLRRPQCPARPGSTGKNAALPFWAGSRTVTLSGRVIL